MPYDSSLFPELPDETFTKSDWDELIGTDQPGGGESLSLESGEAVIVCLVPWEKRRSFVTFTCGFSYADQGPPYRLRRQNPQRHPVFPWLTAATVSFSSTSPVGEAGVGTKVAGIFADSLPVAKYDKCYATVRFVDRPWYFLDDSYSNTPAKEAERNTFLEVSPSIEIISADGLNSLQWTNSSGGAFGPATTGVGNIIPAPFGTLMSKVNYVLNWQWVPNEYISNGLKADGTDDTKFYPANIMACVGRVNSVAFMDFPAGTLLLQAPVFTRFRFPVAATNAVQGFFGWNIKFPLQFFDPDRGGNVGTLTSGAGGTGGVATVTGDSEITTANTVDVSWIDTGVVKTLTNATVSSVTTGGTVITFADGTGNVLPANGTSIAVKNNAYRGQQCLPFRGNLLWYGAKRQYGGKLYPEADFNRIFAHIDSP